MIFQKYMLVLLILIGLTSCTNTPKEHRTRIDLKGAWRFALDTISEGEDHAWYISDLQDIVQLPGTTDLNKKGAKNTDTTTMHLNRKYTFTGSAWYQKKVAIPETFKDKHIQLFIERTKSSKVWIDSIFVGSSYLLQAPQVYDLSKYLIPGEHTLTIEVNNDLGLTPYGNVHIYTDDTQTNWNGMLGEIYLEATEKTYISDVQVYPNLDDKVLDVQLQLENGLQWQDLYVELAVIKIFNGNTTVLPTQQFKLNSQPQLNLTYTFEEEIQCWDDYQQPLYQLTATISNENLKDSQVVSFGMRKFEPKGKQFSINGRALFLRGKNDAAVFPLSGHTPMDKESWKRTYQIAKSYGINHYRFHSYCPPEAAFTAADEEGVYLQVELPFWGGLASDAISQQLKEEGLAMLKAYGNHPSFVLFSAGNELWSGHDYVESIMTTLKTKDKRHLYTMGSNNNIGYLPPRAYCDFFVGARVPENGGSTISHTRLTHAFADAPDGGILNSQLPATTYTFDSAIAKMNIPIISHEIGQYQIYPDYDEIHKYTGVLEAWNLEIFRSRLQAAGMPNMDSIFQQASGVWAAQCYKAEMEAAFRTTGMAGFQLLDLQDFPGQGTALVGVLDAFMDSKNVVTPEVWKQSCNDVVLLLEFPKYCWTNTEEFQAKVVVANYSNKELQGSIKWELKKQDGTLLTEGSFTDDTIKSGGLTSLGNLKIDLTMIENTERLDIQLSIPGTDYSNSYPLWVYPKPSLPKIPTSITVVKKLTPKVLSILTHGGNVLFFPQEEDLHEKSIPGHFPPEFWNYGMFKSISENNHKPVSPGTLGILTDPEHPIFNTFPTDFHTSWQWYSILKASHSLLLDTTSQTFRPIVLIIDNLERNHKLGLLFESKVGEGKLLVCMSPLPYLTDRPEAMQLYRSILSYMDSNAFHPEYDMTTKELETLFNFNYP